MSEIHAEVARSRGALDAPALRLLAHKWAPLISAVLTATFTQQDSAVRVEDMHLQVETFLDELASRGEELPPERDGKALCMAWTRAEWLLKDLDDAENEIYLLAPAGIAALEILDGMTRSRPRLSGSRITTIIDTVSRAATDANPNVEAQIKRLDSQIKDLTARRKRLKSGEESVEVSPEVVFSGFVEVLRNLDGLPGDFALVEQSMKGMHDAIKRDFRDEERLVGEVIDDYLDKSRNLLRGTDEGRAFQGASDLLRDPVLKQQLRDDIALILAHPVADRLTHEEKQRMRGLIREMDKGLERVLSQRQRLSHTLCDYIETYDHIANRELDALLRRAERAARAWMSEARPRDVIEVDILPRGLDVDQLALRTADPADEAEPEPLRPADPASEVDLDQIRRQGGPTLSELAQAIEAARSDGGGTAHEVFNALPDRLRRPVEIAGLLYLLRGQGVVVDPAATGGVETIRADGSRREFAIPATHIPAISPETVTGEHPGDGLGDSSASGEEEAPHSPPVLRPGHPNQASHPDYSEPAEVSA